MNLSMPIIIGLFRVQPEIGKFNGKAAVITGNNALNQTRPSETRDNVKSFYYGSLAGFCFRGDKGGYFEVYLGLRKYDDSDDYETRTSKNLSLGVGFSF